MNTKSILIAIACAGLCLTGHAVPINITLSGSPPFTGSTPVVANNTSPASFGDATVLSWLQSDVTAWNTLNSTSYPQPTAGVGNAPFVKVTPTPGPSSIAVTLGSYDYIFLHWGGQGGGWSQAFYIGNDTGAFTFSAPPGGHPAVGGLSFYSFYGPTPPRNPGGSVPDGGSTLALLGAAMTLVGAAGRKLQK